MQRAVRAFALERFALSIRPAKSNALSPIHRSGIEVVTADDAERFSGLPRDDFFTYRSSRISRSYCHSANGRTLNHSQFLEDKVEHVHASVIEDSAQQLGVPRLEIMIAQDRDHRNSHGGANIGDKCLCFVGEPVFRSPQSSSTSALREISANASCNTPRECLP